MAKSIVYMLKTMYFTEFSFSSIVIKNYALGIVHFTSSYNDL